MNHNLHPGSQENRYFGIDIYLVGSIIQIFQGFETSSPGLRLDFQESLKETQETVFASCSVLAAKGAAQHLKYEPHYLLICRWCWMTMFFSWMVSSRAVARDFRSEMDWGVTGKLQPFSSDCNNSFTAHVKIRRCRCTRAHLHTRRLKAVIKTNLV